MREHGLVSYAKNDYGVDMSIDEAREALRAYLMLYKGVPRYQAKLLAEVRRTGLVWINWCGAPIACRPVPDIGNSNDRLRRSAERVVRNTPIQGGAMQYTARSLIKLHGMVRRGELRGVIGIIGTVHDDIWFRVVRGMEKVAFRAVGAVMVSLPTTRGIPMEVEGKAGQNLGDMVEIGVLNSLDKPKLPKTRRLFC